MVNSIPPVAPDTDRGPNLGGPFLAVMVGMLLVLAAVLLATPRAKGNDDAARRVKVALALAKSAPLPVAPAPRPSGLLSYADAFKRSIDEQSPIVVFVGCPGRKVEGAVTACADSLDGADAPVVIVGYPVGSGIFRDAKLRPCPPSEATLQKAVDAARRKIETQPAGAIPLSRPLNWKI